MPRSDKLSAAQELEGELEAEHHDEALIAAANLGEALAVLHNAGQVDIVTATQALISATLPSTPYRSAALDAFREAMA